MRDFTKTVRMTDAKTDKREKRIDAFLKREV